MRGTCSGLLAVLLLALGAAAPARAQTGPRAARPGIAAPDRLSDAASPRARLLFDERGRVRRGWSLGLAASGGSPEEAARAFVDRFRPSLALAPGAELRLEAVTRAHGFTIVRFVRRAHGGDLLGSSLVVRFAPGGSLDYVAARGLAAPLAAGARAVDRDAAARTALAGAGVTLLDLAPAGLEVDGRVVPVWRADVAGPLQAERSRVLVDARTGEILLSHSLAADALGRVYAHDPTIDDGATTDVELASLTSREHLTGRYFRVSSCNAGDRGCDPTQLAVADADGNFLFDPDEPSFADAFSEVHAYYHLDRVAAYFRDTHEFTWTCGGSTRMEAYVNYAERPGVAYENAAFVPSAGSSCGFIFFGQGGARDYAYASDVVYHEVTHAVVDGVAGLGFYTLDPLGVGYEPGAVNEGTADYFAATLSGDPALAEYFASSPGAGEGALRRLDNDLACPADLVGEPHYDGRIWAGLGWDVREAIGAPRADALAFVTLASLESTPELADAAEVLLATAAAMRDEGTLDESELAAVEELTRARGLEGCARVVPLDSGEPRTAFSGQPMLTGAFGGSIAPVHYRIEVPPDATRLTLDVDRLTLAGRYRVHARVGAPVRFAGTRRPPVIASFDLELDGSGEAVIERGGTPDLPRCETLFFAVEVEDLQSRGPSLYTVRAELETSGSGEPCPEPDAGVQRDAGTDAGPPLESIYAPGGGACTCRAARGRRLPIEPLVLLLLALRRRGGARASRG